MIIFELTKKKDQFRTGSFDPERNFTNYPLNLQDRKKAYENTFSL